MAATNQNIVTFEAGDKALALAMLESSHSFNPTDVRNLANAGAISLEDASGLIEKMRSEPADGNKIEKQNVLHLKAVIITAKDKSDPEITRLKQLYDEEQQIYQSLESKYGSEATVNSGAMIGKVIGSLKSNENGVETCKKIVDFK